jgi:hypothetical protein
MTELKQKYDASTVAVMRQAAALILPYLLLKLEDECDRGLLCTAEWISARPFFENETPRKAGEQRNGLSGTNGTH